MENKRTLFAIAGVLLAGSACVLALRMQYGGLERTDIPGLRVRQHQLDLGRVQMNKIAHAEIELHNLGDLDLHVESSESECGCTLLSLQDRRIPARGILRVPVQLDPKRLPHPEIQKRLRLRVAGPGVQARDLIFRLTGSIDHAPWVAAIPATVDFGRVTPALTVPYVRTIYVSGPQDVVAALPDSIRLSEPVDKVITLQYRPRPLEPASKPITLELIPSGRWPRGDFSFQLQMHFRGDRSYDVATTIMGSIGPPLLSRPARLYFVHTPVRSRTGSDAVIVQVTSPLLAAASNDAAEELISLSTDLPLAWTVHPRKLGSQHLTVEVRLRDDVQPSLAVGHLKVILNNCAEPLAIPVVLVPSGQPNGAPASVDRIAN